MPDYVMPGVYVPEVAMFPPSIAQVDSGIAAFIGEASAGPIASLSPELRSIAAYEAIYGKPDRAGRADPLWVSARAFFAEGGGRLYVVRIARPGDATAFAACLAALGDNDAIEFIAAPGLIRAANAASRAIADALVAHVAAFPFRFALIDAPDAPTNAVIAWAAGLDSSRAALLHPWLGASPVVTKPAIKAAALALPPSAAVAGLYAAADAARGCWKAPDQPLKSAITVKPLTAGEQAMLVDARIDPIVSFPGKGIRLWGMRTLGSDPQWKYVPVRRLGRMIELSVRGGIEWTVFEPNDANTWTRIRGMVENFLILLWRDGALAGAKPEQAFYVRCGLAQTMTALDILEGRLIVEIGFAAVKPAEFIVLRITLMTGSG